MPMLNLTKTLTGLPSEAPEQPAEKIIVNITLQPEGPEGWYCRTSLPCGAFVGARGRWPIEAVLETRRLVLAVRNARQLAYEKADPMLFVLGAAYRDLKLQQQQSLEALKELPPVPQPGTRAMEAAIKQAKQKARAA